MTSLKSIEQKILDFSIDTPLKTAVICGKNRINYKTLWSSILSAKLSLENQGFKLGDRIIIAANKQAEFLYAYFGAHLGGMTTVPVDSQTSADRLKYIIETVDAKAVIGFNEDFGVKTIDFASFETVENSECRCSLPDMDSVADIMFTTGTTNIPKAVPLTFENEAVAARNINAFIKNNSDDIELLALPVSHSFGLGRIRCCLSIGATIILTGNFANIKKIFRTFDEEKVTGFSLVPASWRYLKKMSGSKIADYAKQLKYIEMGSAFFAEEEKKELAQLLPETRICMHYGLTEASRSAFMEFHEYKDFLSSVGKASPFTEIAVFDENGCKLDFYQDGEICVKGEHVTSGYINFPNEQTHFGEFFRTGDWGHLSENGCLYLTGRKNDIINVGGEKVSPVEVETEINKIDGVSESACIGVEDPNGLLGQVVKAFVVKEDSSDVTFDKIRMQIADKLEPYKIPAQWKWVTEIPKTQNGKIQRRLLK